MSLFDYLQVVPGGQVHHQNAFRLFALFRVYSAATGTC